MVATSRVDLIEFTIAADADTTAEIDLSGRQAGCLYLSSELRGISTLKVLASASSGGTFYTVKTKDSAAADYSINLGSGSACVPLDLPTFSTLQFIKFEADTNATGGEFTATLGVRPIG